MERQVVANQLIAYAKKMLHRNAKRFMDENHPCGMYIIKHEDVKKAIPEPFLEYFYECNMGSTCVPEGVYWVDVISFINRL